MGGDDGLILPFMSCGAQGLISVASNLYVRPLVEMVAAANRGDYAQAQTVFQQYLPLFQALFIEPNPVPIKYALQKAGLMQSASVRSPLCSLASSSQAQLDAVLAQLPTPF
jgi:4-hydroxy-tetrahydrodipicolinate synthase